MNSHDRGEGGLGGGVERGRRLIEEPERPLSDKEPGERDAPLLPGRERARGKVDHMGEADPRERRAGSPRARAPPQARRPRRRGSRSRSARLSAHRRGRDNGPLRRACARDRRPPAQTLPPGQEESRRGRAEATICRRRWGLSRSAPSLGRPRTKARKTGAVRRVRSQAATHEGASHPLENARRAGRFKTIVCVACLREFIYKPTIPRLPAFRSAPWPASTVSNAANR